IGFLPIWRRERKQLRLPSGSRFTHAQFDTYSEIWVSLQDLRQAGEELWEKATKPELMQFAQCLQDARGKVAKGAIFFHKGDYIELQNLLQQFSLFRDGKQDLIQYLESHPQMRDGGNSNLDPHIVEQIAVNHRRLTNYIRLLERLRETYYERLAD